ncbi:MAG: LytTR family transcriptional regulator [Desulfarculaceae bacterium]|nr:LytTR family transcriptional regulator [Desulfarculaceae bacterium]
MAAQVFPPESWQTLLRLPRAFLRRPLASFVASPTNRQLLYYKLGLFFLLAVMAGAALTWQRDFLTAHLAFYCTYTVHLAVNYFIGILLAAWAFKRFLPDWSAYERRTVARQWVMWGAGFVVGYLLHRLVASHLIVYYAPWLVEFLRTHPEASPSQIEIFAFFGTAWLLASLAVLQTALKLQKRAAPQAGQAPAQPAPPAAITISHDGRQTRIPLERITHVTVEDHYCRIHYLDGAVPKNLFACMSLKSLAEELPPEDFAQIHRSHLVNLRHLGGLSKDGRKYQAELPAAGVELPISRQRWSELQERLAKSKADK